MLKLREICTKQNPYEDGAAGQWQHPDAVETEYDGNYYIEYKCSNCKLVFRVEMPD